MRERIRIGEVAKPVGVTPKTVRHYQKIGLSKQSERSESGSASTRPTTCCARTA